MKEFFRVAWSDIKERKNLELYLILAVTIAIFVADIFGIEAEGAFLEIVLAALAVLVYEMIDNRHFRDWLQNNFDKRITTFSSLDFFKAWDSNDFTQRLHNAQEVCGLSVVNYEFLRRDFDALKLYLQRGGKLRLIYVKPNSSAFKMVLDRPLSRQGDAEALLLRYKLLIKLLSQLSNFAISTDHLQVKLIDRLPSAVITTIDHTKPNGVVYVTLNGFQLAHGTRPSFALHRQIDGQWFDFYATTFENLWSWPECESVKLGEEISLEQDRV